MKISLVLNSYIGPRIQGATGKEGYQLAMDLYRKGVLAKVFCLGAAPDTELPANMIVSACRSRLCLVVLGYLGRLTKRFPGLRIRRRVEIWMDACFARKVDSATGNMLYCPKPLYPVTFQKSRQLSIQVVVETSVLHPRHNLEMVSRERNRLAIGGTSGYVDVARVRMIERALELADVVYAWSPFLRESYIRYGLGEKKVRVGSEYCEPPGIDIERYKQVADNIKAEEFVVLHVSSISVIKGVQYLIDAWQSLEGRVSGRLLLVGPQDRDMREIRKRYNDATISWEGPVSDPVAYYQRASVFVSPSISDAGPRTVLESMACGVPAIVSDQCGISASIESEVNGFVYHYSDVERLAELIEWCYRNRGRVRSIGQAALKTVAGYSVGNYPREVWERVSQI